jgi:hypothetical protein
MARNASRKKKPMPTASTPKLVRLTYGSPYCELCNTDIHVGDTVAWWRVNRGHGQLPTAYCVDCHHANVRAGRPLQ